MAKRTATQAIQTRRLELPTLTTRLVGAVVAGDTDTIEREVGAKVGRWLTADPSHLVQLNLANQAAEARGYPGLGRVIVLAPAKGARQLIGSIGFHGPPDERGRLEASCRVHPAHRSAGYAAEALAALLDWATARYGVSRFLVAVPSRRERREPVPIEIAINRAASLEAQLSDIDALLDPEPRR